MKRKMPSPTAARKHGAGASAQSAAPIFLGSKVLLVEDGLADGITSKRAELFINKIKGLGGSVDLIKATRITQGTRLGADERDKLLMHLTHVVTGLQSLGARGVLEGLRLLKPDGKEEHAAPSDFKIVSPDWLIACFQQQRLAEIKPYELPFEPPAATAPSQDSKKRPRSASPPPSARGSPGKGKGPQVAPPPRMRAEIEALLDEHFPELDPETREAYIAWGGPLDIRTGRDMPRYACQRPTPRQHPNRHLTEVFEEIEEFYYATGDKERATSFGRALGVLRAWPRRIGSAAEVKGAPYIGDSMLKEVEQILARGTSNRLEDFRRDARAVGLRDLFRIHQVGAATAAKWYAAGYHSVQQIMDELDAAPEGDYTQTAFYQTIKPSHEPWMGVLHFRDYSQKMGRPTVAAIEALVRQAALTVLERRGLGPETLLLETCGGYRRGKDLNGDADILVSCTQAEGQEELREAMKQVMQKEMGLDLIVLKEGAAVQGFTISDHPHEKLPSHDNMLTLVRHEGLYRRLDVISPPPDQWASCVLGWSGTKQMEKDLRDYADSVGLYLSQQAIYKADGPRLHNPKSPDGVFHREEELWEFMGLKFIPPRLRWA